MEQTRGLFCTCDSSVTCCQSQYQCHSWQWVRCSTRIARASELGSCQSNSCISRSFERLHKSKDSLKECFENVNITLYWFYCLLHCMTLDRWALCSIILITYCEVFLLFTFKFSLYNTNQKQSSANKTSINNMQVLCNQHIIKLTV